jgi:hypothetical protein
VGARLGAAANGAGFRGRQVVAHLASLAFGDKRTAVPLLLLYHIGVISHAR